MRLYYNRNGEKSADNFLVKPLIHWVFAVSQSAIMDGKGGSSINHAHLHIIPTNIDLLAECRKFIDVSTIHRGYLDNASRASSNGISYLYLLDRSNGEIVIPVTDLPSQFMRRVVAEKLHMNYDWRVIHNSELIINMRRDTLDVCITNLSLRNPA